MVAAVRTQAEIFRRQFGGLPHVWFSLGVDAYDTLAGGAYHKPLLPLDHWDVLGPPHRSDGTNSNSFFKMIGLHRRCTCKSFT